MNALYSEMTYLDCCLLCGGTTLVVDSIPHPNLYSEKLSEILARPEQQLIDEYPNWRCTNCGLIFKRSWFPTSVIRELYGHCAPQHPRGWDTVLDRFSEAGFRGSFEGWTEALRSCDTPGVRRAQREMTSILDSIMRPAGFDPEAAVVAITRNDVAAVHGMLDAIVASIAEPAQFKRFSGYRSLALWNYLQSRTGGFSDYAEIGCPLWGLLPLAADLGISATLVRRAEANFWGEGCVNDGESCVRHLLRDNRFHSGDWSGTEQHSLLGIFQYLDHATDPRGLMAQVFGKADAAAVIVDSGEAPVAIQHVTGWREPSMRYLAGLFGKYLYTDFPDIRPSGSALYLFVDED